MKTISNIFKEFILEKMQTPQPAGKAYKSAMSYPEHSNTLHRTADTTAVTSQG